ncbi:MAG TPA: hypothetical protein VEP48_05870 [Methylomirabilota bacterium]|nr:hypothetical protein [Methylomirabilota bacterium]
MNRWLVILAALAVGLFLLSYDQRTDDTGIEVGLLVATSLALTVAAPRAAIAIALAIGLPIAAYSLWHGNGPALAALAFSAAGAAIGYVMRRGSLAPDRG